MSKGFYRSFGKRLFDLAVAIPALILFAPILALTSILVRIYLGAPLLFRQERPGRDGRLFKICKFRTMTDARDAAGNLLSDDVRLTRFGKFLRSSSLDELPELWNVITGQMSLVGPRPLKVRYLPMYSPRQSRRHDVTPGITGWAQVNGRNGIGWEERFELDVWYVEHMSLWLDLKILIMTVSAVFRRKGISAEGHVTMPDFEGTKQTIVIGAGGHGKVVVSTLQAAGIAVDAVYDDNSGCPCLWADRRIDDKTTAISRNCRDRKCPRSPTTRAIARHRMDHRHSPQGICPSLRTTGRGDRRVCRGGRATGCHRRPTWNRQYIGLHRP